MMSSDFFIIPEIFLSRVVKSELYEKYERNLKSILGVNDHHVWELDKVHGLESELEQNPL